MHPREKHDDHGADFKQQLQPDGGAFDDGIHGAGRDLARIELRRVRRRLQVGHHQLADQDRSRRTQHRRSEQMTGNVGDDRAENGSVDYEHGSGDASHAPSHHDEKLAARQLREIGTDEQRRFHHAEEDIGRG
jgi:hypothetical protein